MDLWSGVVLTAIGGAIGLLSSLATWYNDVRHRKLQSLQLLHFHLDHIQQRLRDLIPQIARMDQDLAPSEFFSDYRIPKMRIALVDRVLEQWSPRSDRDRKALEVVLRVWETVEALEGRMEKGNFNKQNLHELEKCAQAALERTAEALDGIQNLLSRGWLWGRTRAGN